MFGSIVVFFITVKDGSRIGVDLVVVLKAVEVEFNLINPDTELIVQFTALQLA